ncbi:MAG: hypothetical protein HN457_17165 [Opitutales bacterium]|jgi:hypothetical protein|nr:hypothetical protein [Opitutales bacterium]MDG2254690.1 hypothetical protein [Opitutaceae bacterium]MBT5168118.1 hypothetical protein [Opitutales bacterium]MBT5815231.1 hypothetical protein [Opitutales bacterium]MBT6381617.1 hypothetical protein [Opitutales bacterium]
MASLKPLIMRANRLLGASLVEQGLVSIDDLDEANERLRELMESNTNGSQVGLLAILVNEKQCLDENKLLEKIVEDYVLGLIDIRNVEYPEDLRKTLKTDECWATLTVPFDHVEDTWYLATACYMSSAVRSYWEEKINGNIVWFASSIDSLSEFLEAFDTNAANAAVRAAN